MLELHGRWVDLELLAKLLVCPLGRRSPLNLPSSNPGIRHQQLLLAAGVSNGSDALDVLAGILEHSQCILGFGVFEEKKSNAISINPTA